MKIDKIRIRNFKGIVDLEFTLKNINIFVGPNNTGKSSILQIISFIGNILNEKYLEFNENVRWLFNDRKKNIKVDITIDSINYEFNIFIASKTDKIYNQEKFNFLINNLINGIMLKK